MQLMKHDDDTIEIALFSVVKSVFFWNLWIFSLKITSYKDNDALLDNNEPKDSKLISKIAWKILTWSLYVYIIFFVFSLGSSPSYSWD